MTVAMSSFDPTRRRFYIAAPDIRVNSSDFAFVNEDTALIGGRTAGTHEFPVKGWPHPRSLGVPPLLETPKLVVQVEEKQLLDVYGLRKRFVSSRAKALLTELDGAAFEFAECDTVDGNGRSVEPYWMMDVIRAIDDFDEDRSSFERYIDRFPKSKDPHAPIAIVSLNDIYFDSDVTDDIHAFYLVRYAQYFIFDWFIVERWRAQNFSGLQFTPLQPPTTLEAVQHDYFINYPYWTTRSIG